MSDVRCPYCRAGQDINHDDCMTPEQECSECNEIFLYRPHPNGSYAVFCQRGDHDMLRYGKIHYCQTCDYYEVTP